MEILQKCLIQVNSESASVGNCPIGLKKNFWSYYIKRKKIGPIQEQNRKKSKIRTALVLATINWRDR